MPIATYDDQNFYTLNTIYNLITIGEYSPKYFLAIINSKLGKWFWRIKNSDFKSIFPKIKKAQIESIPIRAAQILRPIRKSRPRQNGLPGGAHVGAAPPLLPRTPQEKEMLQREIEATDQAIDQLVYKLYGLTEDEIRIVEGGA